jgi:hypothetical protein
LSGVSELVRDRGEEVVLETVGLLGVLFGSLCLNRGDDQSLVRFTQLDVELLNLHTGQNRFFPDADGFLAQPDRIFAGVNRRFAPAQRRVVRAHHLFTRREVLHRTLR